MILPEGSLRYPNKSSALNGIGNPHLSVNGLRENVKPVLSVTRSCTGMLTNCVTGSPAYDRLDNRFEEEQANGHHRTPGKRREKENEHKQEFRWDNLKVANPHYKFDICKFLRLYLG